MAETDFVFYIISGLLGFGMYLFKRTLEQQQEDIKELKVQQARIKEEYLPKNDFREFKTELRSMFEEIKTDIKELKK